MKIFSLIPAVKTALWGGDRLEKEFGYKREDDNISEGWVLSAHKTGPSTVANGEYSGRKFDEVIKELGDGAVGSHFAGGDFPILIKLIDAHDKLSVQVHPDNEYARRVENEYGKTEAWYILGAEKGASLIYGTNRDLTKDEFSESVKNSTVTENLNAVEVKAGDVAFIPSGMIHAIGAGILLAEVQQSCDKTYRIFDYDRPDKKTGKPRELHIEKATDVANLKALTPDFSPSGKEEKYSWGTETELTKCEYFTMTALSLDGERDIAADETSFVSLLVTDGEGEIVCGDEKVLFSKGSSLFIPAGSGVFSIRGKAKILETRI